MIKLSLTLITVSAIAKGFCDSIKDKNKKIKV